jgi:hypothetical protein
MDIVSLLFYPSWLNAVRDEARSRAGDPERIDDWSFSIDGGPDWRHALAPLAIIGILVLAGAVYSTGT